jgi:hypothetical protein
MDFEIVIEDNLFKPFELKIHVNSSEKLKFLYHLFCMDDEEIKKSIKAGPSDYRFDPTKVDTGWVDDLCDDLKCVIDDMQVQV